MKRKLPLTPEEFKTIYSKVPRLCVDLIIQTEDGILLTLRQKNGWVGQWHLPGGTVYYRDSIEDTVKRIAREELGIEVKVEKFLKYQEYFSEEKERGFGYSVTLIFVCTPLSTKFTLDDQARKFEFFKTLPKNTVEEQKQFLEEYLENQAEGIFG